MKEKEFDVINFLYRNHISLDEYNFNKELEAYLNEMQTGLDQESSIPMLPTFIEDEGEIPSDEPVLVLDAGGTNFRAAVVTFSDDGKAEISRFKKRSMPGTEKELGKKEFFDEIAEFIADLAEDVKKIGFCFSYPMIKNPEKDGRLTKFSKEIKAGEVEGELIGRGVIEALERRGVTGIKRIVLLNDTVATLLAGKVACADCDYDAHIGLILGTGINASYSESNTNIGKVSHLDPDETQIINMEAGSCGIFPGGKADGIYRAGTANPDAYKFEKMVSGGYIGALWFSILRTASQEGCFSPGFKDALDSAAGNEAARYDAAVLNHFLTDKQLPEPLEGSTTGTDLENAFEISTAIVKRAAYLASVMISGIITKTGKGRHASKPICICVDGTTFWKLAGLKELINQRLTEYSEESGIYFEITGIDNAPVIGAAVAGLTNG